MVNQTRLIYRKENAGAENRRVENKKYFGNNKPGTFSVDFSGISLKSGLN